MALLTTQLRQVLRRFGRAPIFTAVTLLTLAVGIGANTAIFSVVEGVLLKPLPYPHPEELVAVRLTAPGLKVMACPGADGGGARKVSGRRGGTERGRRSHLALHTSRRPARPLCGLAESARVVRTRLGRPSSLRRG